MADRLDPAVADTIANLDALLEWCQQDSPPDAEFFRHDGYVLTRADMQRARDALAVVGHLREVAEHGQTLAFEVGSLREEVEQLRARSAAVRALCEDEMRLSTREDPRPADDRVSPRAVLCALTGLPWPEARAALGDAGVTAPDDAIRENKCEFLLGRVVAGEITERQARASVQAHGWEVDAPLANAFLRAELRYRSREYGRASAEIGRLRGDLARVRAGLATERREHRRTIDDALRVRDAWTAREGAVRPVLAAACAYADSTAAPTDTPHEDVLLDAVAAYRALGYPPDDAELAARTATPPDPEPDEPVDTIRGIVARPVDTVTSPPAAPEIRTDWGVRSGAIVEVLPETQARWRAAEVGRQLVRREIAVAEWEPVPDDEEKTDG